MWFLQLDRINFEIIKRSWEFDFAFVHIKEYLLEDIKILNKYF